MVGSMFSALDMAITSRFLGFVSEVIAFPLSSRTLRALVLRSAHAGVPADPGFAAVFFAPGVAGVAIASWAANRSGAMLMSNALGQAVAVSSKQFREVKALEEIRDALIVLRSALEAELRGTPELALMLTSAFSGSAVDLAETVTATASMPLNGNISLSNYLSTFPIERRKPEIERAVEVSGCDAFSLPKPRQLL
jgi:hypothetical protein